MLIVQLLHNINPIRIKDTCILNVNCTNTAKHNTNQDKRYMYYT